MPENITVGNKNINLSDIATAATVMAAVRIMRRFDNARPEASSLDEPCNERPLRHGTLMRHVVAIVYVPLAAVGIAHMTASTEPDAITSPATYQLEPVEECISTLPPSYIRDTQDLIVDHWQQKGIDLSKVKILRSYGTKESCSSLSWRRKLGPSNNPNIDAIDASNIEKVVPSSGPETNVWVVQAHENGHAVQDIQGVIFHDDIIGAELQADCYAGQAIGALKPEIAEQSLEMISNIGGLTHGTGEQRQQALLQGIQGRNCSRADITALRQDYS